MNGPYYLAADGGDPLTSVLLQYGALGVFVVILVGLARTFIKREQDRADRLEAEVTRLNTIIQDKTVPALISATQTTQLVIDYLKTLQAAQQAEQQRQQLQKQLEEEYRRRSQKDEA